MSSASNDTSSASPSSVLSASSASSSSNARRASPSKSKAPPPFIPNRSSIVEGESWPAGMELERSSAADASAAVFTRVRVLGCGALEDRVVLDGGGTAEDDATALFELRCLSDGSRSSRSMASICVRALAIVAVSSSCGGPLPNMADFLRRKAEFHLFFTAFSALPGSNLAIFVHALPQRCWASASIVSSSCVHPPFPTLFADPSRNPFRDLHPREAALVHALDDNF